MAAAYIFIFKNRRAPVGERSFQKNVWRSTLIYFKNCLRGWNMIHKTNLRVFKNMLLHKEAFNKDILSLYEILS